MDQFDKLEALFHRLVEIPPGEREAEAMRLAEGDGGLARRALELVTSDENAAKANQGAREAAAAARTFGAYRTLSLLGTGGMGAVFLAERADGQYQQKVAVKVIAPHLAGEAFHERFLVERQILAALNHPNITRLLDGGVAEDGTPYLVIEYVEGRPLDAYCGARRLDLRQRLELFRTVCEPVSYAHRNLVVHRDLKPSNILVTEDGRPMLLDFGTAKLLAGNTTDTGTLAPLLTLRYSSPEQRVRAPITTSTDVFSLGVILYELLTGTWPFGDPTSPEQILQRFAREAPMTPPKALPSDLTSILAKALAPEPEQRYQSVQALSDDVGNWLAGLPVAARPAGFVYRAGKFLRRHWLPVSAASIFLAGVLAAALVAIHQAGLARAEAQRTAKVGQFLSDMLASASEYSFNPKQLTVAEMLDAAAPLVEKSWKDDPAIEASLRASLGASYSAVQRLDQARVQLESARAAFHRLGDAAGQAQTQFFLGVNAANGSLYGDAVRSYREAIRLLAPLGKDAPPLLEFRCKLALADTDAVTNKDLAEAHRLVDECLRLSAREAAIPRSEAALASSVRGAILLDEGNNEGAEQALRQAAAVQGDLRPARTLQTLYYLVILNSRRGNFTDAAAFARQYYEIMLRRLGPDHVRTLDGKLLWERYRADLGQAREALQETLETMRRVRQYHPPMSLDLWTPLAAAVHVANLAEQFTVAEPMAREALAVAAKFDSKEADGRKAQPLAELGIALRGQHRYREAASAFERAGNIYRSLGPSWAKRADEVRKMLVELPATPELRRSAAPR